MKTTKQVQFNSNNKDITNKNNNTNKNREPSQDMSQEELLQLINDYEKKITELKTQKAELVRKENKHQAKERSYKKSISSYESLEKSTMTLLETISNKEEQRMEKNITNFDILVKPMQFVNNEYNHTSPECNKFSKFMGWMSHRSIDNKFSLKHSRRKKQLELLRNVASSIYNESLHDYSKKDFDNFIISIGTKLDIVPSNKKLDQREELVYKYLIKLIILYGIFEKIDHKLKYENNVAPSRLDHIVESYKLNTLNLINRFGFGYKYLIDYDIKGIEQLSKKASDLYIFKEGSLANGLKPSKRSLTL